MIDKKVVVGVDVGGTLIKAGIIDLRKKKIVQKSIFPTPKTNSEDFINLLKEEVGQLCEMSTINYSQLCGIGIGIPGYVKNCQISMVWPFLKFIERKAFYKEVVKLLKLPVRIDNDARVVALGEAYFGRIRLPQRLLSLTIGTGLGVVLLVNGLFQDNLPFSHMAGHIAVQYGAGKCYYCGIDGCLESLISGDSIIRRFKDAKGESLGSVFFQLNVEDVYKFAEEGDKDAERIINSVVNYLIVGINSYIYLYAPDVIVLGGGQAIGLAKYLDQIQKGLVAKPFVKYKISISISKLGVDAGMLGSGALFLINKI